MMFFVFLVLNPKPLKIDGFCQKVMNLKKVGLGC